MKVNEKILEVLEIAKQYYAYSFDETIEFLKFAKIMDDLGQSIYSVPSWLKVVKRPSNRKEIKQD